MEREPLLLLHGALGTAGELDRLAHMLSKDFDVYQLTFSGHGLNTGKTEFDMEKLARDVTNFVDKQPMRKINVFGYSMGGYAALCAAKDRPRIFKKIITLGTKFDWTPDTAAQETAKLDPEVMLEKVPQFAQYLEKIHGKNWKAVVESTALLMRQLGDNPVLTEKSIQQLKHHALICVGDNDQMVSRAETAWVGNLMKNGTYLVIDNFEHAIGKIDTEVLAELINNFIHHAE